MAPLSAYAKRAAGAIARQADAVKTSAAPVPPVTEDYNPQAEESFVRKGLDAVEEQFQRGAPVPMPAVQVIDSIVNAVAASKGYNSGIDDRKLAMEEGLVFLSRAPPGPTVTSATQAAIRLLYNDLPHPPSNLSEPGRFRSADGSGYNRVDPTLGSANTPYGRDCPTNPPVSDNELPDASLVFDMLLKRDEFKPHPAGLSGMFFTFATSIIHTIFRTSRTDWNINQTSSYLDMSILYGHTQAHQDKMRVVDGRGKLLPDCFAETRILNLPPTDHSPLQRGAGNSCSVEFNVLYRWHTALTEEDVKWTEDQFQRLFGNNDWDSLTPDLFEATLVTKAVNAQNPTNPLSIEQYFAMPAAQRNKLLYEVDYAPRDYLRVPWGQNKRDPSTQRYSDDLLAGILQGATAAPAAAFKARGIPNVMRAIELLGIEQARHWGCCSLNDFRRYLGLKPYSTFEEWNPDPKIASAARMLYRNPENLELYVGLLAEETKSVGPGAGLCPGYTPVYYSISRAILSDAVALVRGDPYFTYLATSYNLTSFGYTEGQRNINNAAYGGMIGRVLQRALPNHYNSTSTYTHFPFVTPTGQPYSMDILLHKNGVLDRYTIDRPIPQLPIMVVYDPPSVGSILDVESLNYITLYGGNIKAIGLDSSFLRHIDEPPFFANATKLLRQLVIPAPPVLDETLGWFRDRAMSLMREKSLSVPGTSDLTADVVKDVFRLLPVHWSSYQVAGLPLKSTFTPKGVLYEQQLFLMLREIYSFVYAEPENSLKIPLMVKARDHVANLTRLVQTAMTEATGGRTKMAKTKLSGVRQLVRGSKYEYNDAILKRMASLNLPMGEAAANIVGLIATVSIELFLIYTHVVNFFLAPLPPPQYSFDPAALEAARRLYGKKKALQEAVTAVANDRSPQSLAALACFVREALRLDPAVRGLYRKAKAATKLGNQTLTKDQRLYLDLAALGNDGTIFAAPGDVNPTRPEDAYKLLQGDGAFKILGSDFVYGTAAVVLQVVFSLKNLRRATGKTGTLRRFKTIIIGPADVVIRDGDRYQIKPGNGPRAEVWQYLDPEDQYRLTPWPTGLSIMNS
ncbi:heme peroxidase [Clavulina sp. PMI_390]|nr:heme peroxidase [Clavulina sp. PMI_390]